MVRRAILLVTVGACSATASACTYVTIVNGGDSGLPDDSGSDAKIGTQFDAGAEAETAPPACNASPSSETDTESCEPRFDSFCPVTNCGAYATHYRCSSGNRPTHYTSAGQTTPMTCIEIGDAGDHCCTELACVLAKNFASTCSSLPAGWAVACADDASAPTGLNGACQKTNAGDSTDVGAAFFCCQ